MNASSSANTCTLSSVPSFWMSYIRFNGSVDCSVTNISYDANGNLLTMTRKGILAGTNGGVVVDNLAYHYQSIGGAEWTNKLESVSDNGNGLGAQNGKLGDFTDANTSGTDYDYDANGNTINDRNKNVKQAGGKGIEWNYMDKPQVMRIDGKSTVQYIYDATGAKLCKRVTPVSGAVHTTWYMGSYLYEEDAANTITLKYILHEEGRIRLLTPQNTFNTEVPGLELSGSLQMPDSKQGAMEWMLKDHQGSTRMVLTEEVHREYHLCQMEYTDPARKDYEERNFGNIDNNGNIDPNANEVVISRTSTPHSWGLNNTDNVAVIKGDGSATGIVGPNMFLKVMAGDLIHARTDYFYEGNLPAPTNDWALFKPLAYLIAANFNNGMVSNAVKDNTNGVRSNLYTAIDFFNYTDNRPPQPNDLPKAYLNWAFFDENFKFIPQDGVGGGSGYLPIEHEGNGGYFLTMPDIKAPKNGYAFVYLSNTSEDHPVFFDNFEVTHERGRIIEEATYYPDGLKIVGLCAKAYNKLPNEFGYQGDYSEEEEETDYDEFALRMYDPTIGRWLGVDPYDEFASPYVGMGADPVNNVDPDGGSAVDQIIRMLLAPTSANVPLLSSSWGTSGSSSAASSSGSPSVGALNSLGNAAVGYVAQKMADVLFPLPKGPDAKNLQSPGNANVKVAMAGMGHENTAYTQSDIYTFDYRAKSLSRKSGYIATQVNNGKEIISKLKEITLTKGAIDILVIFSHAGLTGIYLDNNEGFYSYGASYGDKDHPGTNGSNVWELRNNINNGNIKFNQNAVIVLGGCNCANPDDPTNSLAYSITVETGITTYGATAHVTPEKIKGKETGRLVADGDYGTGTFIKFEKVTVTVQKEFRIFGWRIPYRTRQTIIRQTDVGKVIDPNNP